MDADRPRRSAILHPESGVRRVCGGLRFAEGPVWHPVEHHLTFSDIPSNRLWRMRRDGVCSVLVEPSHHANGNAYDRQGRLVTCEHSTSRVVRREIDGSVTVLADGWGGRELNSPNDVIVLPDGAICFTDPPYGRMARSLGGRRPIPQPVNGVYRVDRGGVTLMVDDFDMPNGLCTTASGDGILVADTARGHIRRFSLSAEGRWRGGDVFADVPCAGLARPDGLKCDSAGNVFCTGAGGIHVFTPDGGHVEVIRVPELVANFAHGGKDLKTLFIAASTSIYSVRLRIAGLPAFDAVPLCEEPAGI